MVGQVSIILCWSCTPEVGVVAQGPVNCFGNNYDIDKGEGLQRSTMLQHWDALK